MASITNNSRKYGEGHQVILKDPKKGALAGEKLMMLNGYILGKDIFTVTLKPKVVDNWINFTYGNASVFLKDAKKNVIQIIGSEGNINGLFNHHKSNAKSNTNVLTEVKENISMWLFQGHFENKKLLSEDEIITKLNGNKLYYSTTFYESAVKQLTELKKYIKYGGYNYERQGGTLTKPLYTAARKLTNKANDNWNPADVWMIKKGYDLKTIIASKNHECLNGRLAEAYYKKDIIPISLKNVTTRVATSSIIDSSKLMNVDPDLNLKFDKLDFSETFANFILMSKSGFAVRAGFKASSTTLGVSLEGRMIGAGYQLGAVDASDYKAEVSDIHNYTLRTGNGVGLVSLPKAKAELKEIIMKYPRISNTIKDYDHAIRLVDEADDFIKQRFINIVSYLYSFMILPKVFETHLKFCYFSSKKITDKSGLYLILQ